MDFALIAQASTLRSRIPFLHIFDGFRTSHEVMKIEKLDDLVIREMIDDDLVHAHRSRALSPDHPVMRGTAQNPDVYFQARETVNPFYAAVPDIVQTQMDKFAKLTGRQYRLFDYVGAPDAERVIILMGSGAETVQETVDALLQSGEKIGVLKVRLYRPFSAERLLAELPKTAQKIAILDRTKEPGACGEPLYQDVVTAFAEASQPSSLICNPLPRIIGGRYGLSSKEFTPAMVKAIFDELAKPEPKNHFTIGINDDVSHTSLEFDPSFSTEPDDVVRAVFWGLGSDGTVGANKNSIKIIGEETDHFAQGYFVYDSKKSGSVTVSHLRFGPRPIRSTYLIQRANFIAVHQFNFVTKFPVLDAAEEGATVLLNCPYGPDDVWDRLPAGFRKVVVEKRLKLFVIDGDLVAREAGMGNRVNTVMQTAFFALSGVLPRKEAIDQIKKAIKKSYGKRGEAVVQKNYAAVDRALAHLFEVQVPILVSNLAGKTDLFDLPLPDEAPQFVKDVTAEMMAFRGDQLPVSALPADGTYPVGTSQWEKRNIALEVPEWEPDLCIQCGKCMLVCPHAVIRANVVPESALTDAPEGFKSMTPKWRELADQRYTLQISPEDCTGCALCVEVCPAKDKTDENRKSLNMVPHRETSRDAGRHWKFFNSLPDFQDVHTNGDALTFNTIKNLQVKRPLFEFSGACSGCGETPYLILLSRLFGDRSVIANATGCSSIYGGNLPTTPWTANQRGRGPAWSNSLFEDNAEFGLGMRLTLNQQEAYARRLVEKLKDKIGEELSDKILRAEQFTEETIEEQRARVQTLRVRLAASTDPQERDLASLADALVKKCVWIVGGDGWAYDIGFGGLDHVLSTGQNVNILVLDTEVYSNTGGQASKSTARGAVAKFAAGGKPRPKKDLGRMAMSYGNVYVAQVAMGANDSQVVKAFLEAEAYDGPSIVIAYGHCIAHGIDMRFGMSQQKLAVESGYWPLFRFHPDRADEGKNPFQLDSKAPAIPLEDYIYTEGRYKMLRQSDPEAAAALLTAAQQDVRSRWEVYAELAAH
jgi:pyruvate-ferredoxin/flavodoxin oxidoreductase